MLRNATLVLVLVVLAGCPAPPGGGTGGGGGSAGGSGGGSGGGGGGGTGGGDPGDAGLSYAISPKGVVRFKRNERIANDFGAALGLAPASVCNELGQYSCTQLVHPLTLGGVDPYNIGLYEPLPFTGLTTPIVVDRIALAACSQRVTADFAAPTVAVIFKGITLDASGKLTNLDAPAVRTSLETLYERALLRMPTDAEVEHHKQLYRDILATAKPAPATNWMTLSCFAVLSSVESVFY